ncbi:MAG TPA: osmotically-inducible lipoprotein OsmB [Proteus vulgaris]|nr:osmotically-inducible lipoprotein OsmB [Proteus vulgaris]
MNITLKKIGTLTLCVASVLLFSLAGCSSMTKRDRNTAIGAGAGAIGGAILTDGSALGTIGGGVLGGVIGHQVGKK